MLEKKNRNDNLKQNHFWKNNL